MTGQLVLHVREDQPLREAVYEAIRRGILLGNLSPDERLMEIKVPGALPLWFVRLLSENKAYKTSFSKVGSAYQKSLNFTAKGGQKYA